LQLLLSICSLLTDPDPHKAQNVEAAKLFLNDREKYKETLKEWTNNYAYAMYGNFNRKLN
jgi:ubiquitin-conjugating enzyme E2 D/E